MNINATAPMAVNFDAIMTQLLNGHHAHRATLDRSQFLAADYLQEACSVALDPGRQTGKSTWIMHNVRDDDIIIAVNAMHRSSLRGEINPRFLDPRIFTVKEITDGVAPGPYNRCFVDSASNVFDRIRKRVFYTWAFVGDPENEHTFILLG